MNPNTPPGPPPSPAHDDDEPLREIPDEIKQQMVAQHGAEWLRILEAQRPRVEVLVKIPSQGAIDVYKKDASSITDPEKMSGAPAALFWSCVLYPPKKELALLLRQTPLTADVLGAEVIKLAGERQTVRVKKL